MNKKNVLFLLLSVFSSQAVVGLEATLGSVHSGAAVQADHIEQEVNVSADEVDDDLLKRLADIRVHSAEELGRVLGKVDELFVDGGISEQDEPVVFLLHGNEALTLYKQNYDQNKNVIDLAAKLSAFGVVDIKVCEVWSKNKGLDNNRLQPFVSTVPFAPGEKRRLVKEEGYQYF